jgi:hypothetical protein
MKRAEEKFEKGKSKDLVGHYYKELLQMEQMRRKMELGARNEEDENIIINLPLFRKLKPKPKQNSTQSSKELLVVVSSNCYFFYFFSCLLAFIVTYLYNFSS